MPSHATAFALSTPARLYGLALHRWQDSNLQLTDLESAHILQYAAPILKAAVHQRCLYLSDMLSMQTPRRPFGLTGDLLPRGVPLGSLATCSGRERIRLTPRVPCPGTHLEGTCVDTYVEPLCAHALPRGTRTVSLVSVGTFPIVCSP